MLTHFNLSCTATNLVGYVDQNFRIVCADKQAFVLKIMGTQTSLQVLAIQNEMMNFLQNRVEGLATPKVIANIAGEKITTVTDDDGNSFSLRLLSWLEGELWENAAPNNLVLYEALGQKLGEMTAVLQEFVLPCAFPPLHGFHWETVSAAWIRAVLERKPISGQNEVEKHRKMVALHFLNHYENKIQPHVAALRDGFIHNDANGFNILVGTASKQQKVAGLIDFGLALPSKIVCELAVACAYLCMNRPNILEIIAAVSKGFQAVFPLNEAEQNALFPLMARRLLISVAHSALNREKGITDEYVYAFEQNAWILLEKMYAINWNTAAKTNTNN